MDQLGTWKPLVRFGRRFWWVQRYRWSAVITLMALATLCQIPAPLLTMVMIDRAVPRHDSKLLLIAGLGALGLYALRSCCLYLSDRQALILKEETTLRIQTALLEHVLSLPISFHGDNHSGYLQSRIMGDARSLDASLVKTIAAAFFDTVTVAISFVLILRLRINLAAIILCCIVPFVIVRLLTHRSLIKRSHSLQEQQGHAALVVYESLAAIRTLKAGTSEAFQLSRADQALKKLRDEYVATNTIHVTSSSITGFITGGGIALILLWGCFEVIRGSMTIGETIAIASYLGLLFAPISNLAGFQLTLSSSLAAIHRINSYLALAPELSGSRPVAKGFQRIVFDNVTFAYRAEQPALREVSLLLPSHSITAIVGATGAGKSTLISLLLRFHDPDSGRILLDGVDLREIRSDELRSLIGLVDQQTYIFNGTILENIIHGCSGATMEKVRHACKMAFASEFIDLLPHGYETLVGERGAKLSTGQRQRLALARIFLRAPEIVVLDEAVSGVDAESESYIQAALRVLAQTKTILVVAHRLSSLMLADQVIVLEHGQVSAVGTHSSLLANSKTYQTLFREQFRPQQSTSPISEEIQYA